jgi:hypothetical protein
VASYAQALARGDDDAVWAMMSNQAKTQWGQERVRQRLKADRTELAHQATSFASSGAKADTFAKVALVRGHEAHLTWDGKEFRIASADVLPGGARTPEQALTELRWALQLRSFDALVGLLSPTTRRALEQDLKSLVEGLEAPQALDVKQVGDVATVVVPGGHQVRLHRQGDVWKVDDFD